MKIKSDSTSVSQDVNYKSDKGHEVNFVITISKNSESTSNNWPFPI